MGHLGSMYWILLIYFCMISMCMFQMTSFLTDFLSRRFNYGYLDSKNLVAIKNLVYTFLIPVLSAVAQPIGKKPVFFIISSLIAVGSFQTMELLDAQPGLGVTISIVAIGVFFSCYTSVIWSCVALVVPKQGVQIALGLIATSQSILLSTLTIWFGYINKERTVEAYNNSLLLLKVIGLISLVFSIVMVVVDYKTGGRLMMRENDPRVLKAKED